MPELIATTATPPGWRESLERSKVQVMAGERVPLLTVLDRLRASAASIEPHPRNTM